jgi:hypothetical protein
LRPLLRRSAVDHAADGEVVRERILAVVGGEALR